MYNKYMIAIVYNIKYIITTLMMKSNLFKTFECHLNQSLAK